MDKEHTCYVLLWQSWLFLFISVLHFGDLQKEMLYFLEFSIFSLYL